MRAVIAITTLLFLLLNSCQKDSIVGPGSETVSVAATLYYPQGIRAEGSNVTIRRRDYTRPFSQPPQTIRYPDAITDYSGSFVIDSVIPGSYIIEVNDSKGHAIALNCEIAVSSNGVVELLPDTLRPVSTLRGRVVQRSLTESIYVQIYGLERDPTPVSHDGTFFIDNLPHGNFNLRFAEALSDSTIKNVENVSIEPERNEDIGTFDLESENQWKHAKSITLNTSPSGADISADIFNFPILVRLNQSNFDFQHAKTGGTDLLFTNSSGTPLTHEIERWDPVNSKAELWVLMDTVWGDNDEQYIMMHWGNDNYTHAFRHGDVFDTTFGYQAVFHFSEPQTDQLTDATHNTLNSSEDYIHGTSPIESHMAYARSFNGTDEFIQVPNTAESKINFSWEDSFTLSAWVYTPSLEGELNQIVSKGNMQYGLQLQSNDMWQFFYYFDSADTRGWLTVSAPATPNQWTHITAVKNQSELYLYINGTMESDEPVLIEDHSRWNNSLDLYVGRRSRYNPETNEDERFWRGYIDEVRIKSGVPDPDRVKLSFMNQREEDLLLIFNEDL
ncbi:DUF2341 domain-containing protein [Chitinispirillales bacterium ANBcel5]|uniref:DUF2341 domain-containing protein n=1 Tax=Cellulosispirillum alkaliphilum TaxID=3039283 RepID=UPI002A552362|nr:DUF2341 domain-containing protein [Chitinispirillales bacterium ANBcel5]